VNGGLARSEGRRVIPSAGASSERTVAGRPHRPRRERTGARPRVARERHSAVTTSPKAVAWSRDRGCNDHRILRRVSCRQKSPRIITEHSGHAEGSRVVFGATKHPSTRAPRPKAKDTARWQPLRR